MVNAARSFAVILVAMLVVLVVLVSSEQVQAQKRQFKSRGFRSRDTLKVGDKAPDFTLKKLNSKKKKKEEKVTLSSFQGKKPVVLVFGSYT